MRRAAITLFHITLTCEQASTVLIIHALFLDAKCIDECRTYKSDDNNCLTKIHYLRYHLRYNSQIIFQLKINNDKIQRFTLHKQIEKLT